MIDEDLPRSLAAALVEAQHEATHVAASNLRGRTDDEIMDHCRATESVLVTADLGFSSIHRFPLGTHAGMVIARLPNEMSVVRGNQLVLDAILDALDELGGSLLVVEPGKTRLRSAP